MRSLTTAATGMFAQQMNVEVISNNIANATTTGYKRRRAEFADLLYQDLRRVGTQSSDSGTIVPAGVQIGVGVKPVAVYRIHEQGNLQMTDNPLDIAIKGRGFFQVDLPDGTTAYTRDGSFKLSDRRRDRDGRRLHGAAGHHGSGRTPPASPSTPAARSRRPSPARSRRTCSASSSWRTSSTRPAWTRSATTC